MGYMKGEDSHMDEFDVHTTPYDASGDTPQTSGSSRRSFLKAAVIGSAAAVAVSGAGAATLTLTGHHTGLKRFVTLTNEASGLTGHACTTDTGTGDAGTLAEKGSQTNPFQNQESIYFWFKVNNVPVGTYTFDFSPPAAAFSQSDYTSGTLVMYNDGSANDVNAYEYAAGTANFDCSPPSLTSLSSDATLSGSAGSAPLTFDVKNSAKDVLIQVHLKGIKNNPGGSVTLTATLYQGSDDTGPVEATASDTFYIHA